jgi:hypothetical protein
MPGAIYLDNICTITVSVAYWSEVISVKADLYVLENDLISIFQRIWASQSILYI